MALGRKLMFQSWPLTEKVPDVMEKPLPCVRCTPKISNTCKPCFMTWLHVDIVTVVDVDMCLAIGDEDNR
jgi:hypothetical protein